jgi:hypothetical protein
MLVIDEHSLSILIEESERLVFIAEEEVSTGQEKTTTCLVVFG